MDRYKNGKIYKIVCNKTGLCYIGSTCEPTLALRLAKHRSNYKTYINGNGNYISSYQVLENNDYSIVLLESIECNSKDELLARERFYIENTECVNMRKRPFVSEDENNERIKKYRETNKDSIISYKVINRDHIKNSWKKYYDKNKDRLKDSGKDYYHTNKDKLNEKYDCKCGGKYTFQHRAKHLKTLKHLNYCKTI